jgi:hypothetical protein
MFYLISLARIATRLFPERSKKVMQEVTNMARLREFHVWSPTFQYLQIPSKLGFPSTTPLKYCPLLPLSTSAWVKVAGLDLKPYQSLIRDYNTRLSYSSYHIKQGATEKTQHCGAYTISPFHHLALSFCLTAQVPSQRHGYATSNRAQGRGQQVSTPTLLEFDVATVSSMLLCYVGHPSFMSLTST